jgi:tRNA 2-(methylsulfanyl)-N6-isopentenyladenosine37 hydroxylase
MLGLKVSTDAGWAAAAVRDAAAVLVDHAHCELKAASNALSLVGRHAWNEADPSLVQALTDLAREEIEHFQRVLAVLATRGVPMGPPPVDAYAAALRRAASQLPRHPDMTALVDRLLVGALIEARSCERFQLLADAVEGHDAELHALWHELLASEARHYRTFVDLAVRAAGGDRASVVERLDRLAEAEGAIVSALARGGEEASRATMHG